MIFLQGIEKKYLLATLALLVFLAVAGFVFKEKSVVLTLDGKTLTVKTNAPDVAGFLREQKITHQDQDLIFPPLSSSIEEGMHIVIEHATSVIVELDGKKKKVLTVASTVRGAIQQAGVELGEADKITPGPEVRITKNLQIIIIKAVISLDSNRVAVPYRTITQEDSSLPKGRAVVVQEGKEGLALQIYNVKSVDNQEIERELHAQRYICAPVDEVIKVGTKRVVSAKPARTGSTPAVTVSRGGGRTLVLKGTAYSPGHGSGYGTASGMRAQYGVVAVDPRVIPLGTKLYVEGYGEAVAGDTGGAIKGNRIDLCYNSESECVAFGRRDVVVHIQE